MQGSGKGQRAVGIAAMMIAALIGTGVFYSNYKKGAPKRAKVAQQQEEEKKRQEKKAEEQRKAKEQKRSQTKQKAANRKLQKAQIARAKLAQARTVKNRQAEALSRKIAQVRPQTAPTERRVSSAGAERWDKGPSVVAQSSLQPLPPGIGKTAPCPPKVTIHRIWATQAEGGTLLHVDLTATGFQKERLTIAPQFMADRQLLPSANIAATVTPCNDAQRFSNVTIFAPDGTITRCAASKELRWLVRVERARGPEVVLSKPQRMARKGA